MENRIKSALFVSVLLFFAGCSKNAVAPATTQPLRPANQHTDAVTPSLVIPPSGVPFSAVSIVGVNFSPVKADNKVLFNGMAGVVNYASANLIIATVPQNAATGKITVISKGNLSISANDFKVLHMVADGNIPQESFLGVSGLAFDNSGNAYGITSANTEVVKFANGKSAVIYTTPATPRPSLNNFPTYTLDGIVADRKGNVYVTQNYYNAEAVTPFIKSEILKITPGGTVSVFAGGLRVWPTVMAALRNLTRLAAWQ